jgi:hypothetical protein
VLPPPFQVTIWNLPLMMAYSFLEFLPETFDRKWPNAGRQLLPEAGALAQAGGSQLHALVRRDLVETTTPYGMKTLPVPR